MARPGEEAPVGVADLAPEAPEDSVRDAGDPEAAALAVRVDPLDPEGGAASVFRACR